MVLPEVLAALFTASHSVAVDDDGLIGGTALLATADTATPVAVIGLADGVPLSPAGALSLADRVLRLLREGKRQPLLVLVDSGSQRMSRRDELLGLNEYLAHLAKVLLLADMQGYPTIGLLYGHSAAGAFIATALAARAVVALPGAHPEVMDLPSMARVTKLPLELLARLAQATPVFAPGLENMVKLGGVCEVWEPGLPLDQQLWNLLGRMEDGAAWTSRRSYSVGSGRPKTVDIIERVRQEASANA